MGNWVDETGHFLKGRYKEDDLEEVALEDLEYLQNALKDFDLDADEREAIEAALAPFVKSEATETEVRA